MNDEIQAKMTAAVETAKRGDFTGAYPLFREISRSTPRRAEAWIWRAVTSGDRQEALVCLSRALRLEPENRAARKKIYEVVKDYLEDDPYLEYDRETDRFYVVRTSAEQKIHIPKERQSLRVYPPEQPPLLAPVYRWLLLSIGGLILAGFGAMVGAIVTVLIARRLQKHARDEADRKRLIVAQLLAGVVFVLGSFMAFLFLIHF